MIVDSHLRPDPSTVRAQRPDRDPVAGLMAEVDRLQRLLGHEKLARQEAEVAAAQAERKLEERTRELEQSAAAARRLLADALMNEDRERGRLVQLLHDYSLQSLLTARQDLVEATQGDPDGLDSGLRALDVAVMQMRETMAGLHPASLDHAGLAVALETLANEAADRAGFDASVVVEDGVGHNHDVLLLSVVRELLQNIVRHANATIVRLTLRGHGALLELAVTDDGIGFARAPSRRDALEEGTIGLMSVSDRVAAVGGEVAIRTGIGIGTTVTVRIPTA